MALLDKLQSDANAAGLGLTVSGVHLTDVTVPAPVVAAFLDVISADEERQTTINMAEAYASDLLPRTRGDAVAAIVRAQGAAVEIEAKAVGYDTWFRAVQENGSQSPRLTRARLAAETQEINLQRARLVAAPPGVRVWLGEKEYGSRDPESANGGQGP